MSTHSLTEVRQNLFALADRVVETGEPLVIERRGVRLILSREVRAPKSGRLAKLLKQQLVVGAPLAPDESPAAWSGATSAALKVAEPAPTPLASRGRSKR